MPYWLILSASKCFHKNPEVLLNILIVNSTIFGLLFTKILTVKVFKSVKTEPKNFIKINFPFLKCLSFSYFYEQMWVFDILHIKLVVMVTKLVTMATKYQKSSKLLVIHNMCKFHKDWLKNNKNRNFPAWFQDACQGFLKIYLLSRNPCLGWE